MQISRKEIYDIITAVISTDTVGFDRVNPAVTARNKALWRLDQLQRELKRELAEEVCEFRGRLTPWRFDLGGAIAKREIIIYVGEGEETKQFESRLAVTADDMESIRIEKDLYQKLKLKDLVMGAFSRLIDEGEIK